MNAERALDKLKYKSDPTQPPQASGPSVRRLQIYTLDPASDTKMSLAVLSRSTLALDWEPLDPGPVGEYLEIVDYDPSSGCFYAPVDLDTNELLATDGVAPSVGDPRFHQQMVYAISMNTIRVFERVLGRSVIWSERVKDDAGGSIVEFDRRFVQRLRLYPHALRSENAYYSPGRKAILFGYFNARPQQVNDGLPGGITFTCLSHDIVVHEVTHAILDSVHPKLLHSSNHDMLAFHEGFADIVAIFQHFSLPNLLRREIEITRGDLKQNNLLADLACQFARATGRGSALRTALGSYEDGERKPPSVSQLEYLFEPHDRGAILVAAVFDAFLLIYDSRVKDLRRIATNGSGILPDGEIHPDLANRLAAEAVKIAQRVLHICIRAIDYLPPVDITFGDYFRALITADRDAVPHDVHYYRLAFIESFKEKGIYPHDVRNLSENSLRWIRIGELEDEDKWETLAPFFPQKEVLKTMVLDATIGDDLLQKMKEATFDSRQQANDTYLIDTWMAKAVRQENIRQYGNTGRLEEYRFSFYNKMFIQKWIEHLFDSANEQERRLFTDLLGISVPSEADKKQYKSKFEVLSVRKLVRPKPDGISTVELFVSVAMRQLVNLTDEYGEQMKDADDQDLRFFFRSGATLIVDPDYGRIRYAIKKNHFNTMEKGDKFNRLEQQKAFYRNEISRHGEKAIHRYGLTEGANEIRAGIEAFEFVHEHSEDLSS